MAGNIGQDIRAVRRPALVPSCVRGNATRHACLAYTVTSAVSCRLACGRHGLPAAYCRALGIRLRYSPGSSHGQVTVFP